MEWLRNPKNRVKAALWTLFASVVLMIINVTLYLLGLIDEAMLILITLILSWLAITLNMLNIVATADVRKETDKEK